MNLLLVQLYKRRHHEAKILKKSLIHYTDISLESNPFFPFSPSILLWKLQTYIKAQRLQQWTSVCPSPFYGNISLYLLYPLSICLVIPLDIHQVILFFWCIWNCIADVSTFSPKHFIMHVISWRSVFISNIILMMENGYTLNAISLQYTVCVLESMPPCYENS